MYAFVIGFVNYKMVVDLPAEKVVVVFGPRFHDRVLWFQPNDHVYMQSRT